MPPPVVTVTLGGTDISADVASPSGTHAIVYGRGSNFDGSSESPGYATVMLKNADYRYNPDNSGSSRYALLKVGKALRVTVTYNAVTYYLYHGYVRRIVPNPVTKFAEIVTQDAMFNFSRRETSVSASVSRTLKSFRDAILDDILEAGANRSLTLGNGPENEVPYTGADQRNALGVLDEINAATASYHYIKPNAADYTYTTKDRLFIQAGTLDETWSDVDTANPFATDISGWDYTDENIINSQRVYATPRLLEEVNSVVWQRKHSLTVDASTTETRWARFDEPTFEQVLSYSIVGAGGTVTFTPFARSAKIVITAGVNALTVRDLKITGARALVTELHSALDEAPSSITDYGRLKGGDIQTDYLSSTAQAKGLAQWITYRYAKPRSFPTVRFENRFPTQLVREIGDRVRLVAARLSVDQHMYVRSFETRISEGGAIWTTDYDVEEASAIRNLFTLGGTADQGLGGTALLGF